MKQNNLILAVNGTLMRGLELENNLKEAGASFIKESKTEKAYRLFSINDKYPAMVKDANGSAIDVELYEISEQGMQEVLSLSLFRTQQAFHPRIRQNCRMF